LDQKDSGTIAISDFGCVLESYDDALTPAKCLQAFEGFGGELAIGQNGRMDIEGLAYWFAYEFRSMLSDLSAFNEMSKKILAACERYARLDMTETSATQKGFLNSISEQSKYITYAFRYPGLKTFVTRDGVDVSPDYGLGMEGFVMALKEAGWQDLKVPILLRSN